MAAAMWPEARPLSRVAAKSVCRKQLRPAELGHAHADGVAVRGFGSGRAGRSAAPSATRPSRALWSLNFRPTTFGSRPVPLMSLPIRSISSTSTCSKRQPRQPTPGQRQQFLLAGLELLGRDGLDPRRLVVGVFDDGHSGQDVAASQHFAGHAADDLGEAEVLDRAVIDLRPFAIAQPDQQHFHQSALDRADRNRCAA